MHRGIAAPQFWYLGHLLVPGEVHAWTRQISCANECMLFSQKWRFLVGLMREKRIRTTFHPVAGTSQPQSPLDNCLITTMQETQLS